MRDRGIVSYTYFSSSSALFSLFAGDASIGFSAFLQVNDRHSKNAEANANQKPKRTMKKRATIFTEPAHSQQFFWCASVCVFFSLSLIFCTSINFKLPPPSLVVICSCRFGYLVCVSCSRCAAVIRLYFFFSLPTKNDDAIFSIINNKRAEFTRIYRISTVKSKSTPDTVKAWADYKYYSMRTQSSDP